MSSGVHAGGAPKAVGHYPHARRVGDLLFLSGIGPRNPADNTIPGNEYFADGRLRKYDIEAQARAVFANVRAVLEAGGAGPEHLVRLTWYVTDRNEYNSRLKELGAVYREVLGKNFPAMACVQVAGLMEERAKIEIEATAVIPD